MKRILPVIFLIVVLAGCTHYYTKPGKNNSDSNPDDSPQLAAGNHCSLSPRGRGQGEGTNW